MRTLGLFMLLLSVGCTEPPEEGGVCALPLHPDHGVVTFTSMSEGCGPPPASIWPPADCCWQTSLWEATDKTQCVQALVRRCLITGATWNLYIWQTGPGEFEGSLNTAGCEYTFVVSL